MSALHDADLMAIGRHCAVPHCSQLDFLPFKCDCCKQTFCLEHRTYSAHSCTKSGSKQLEIIVCPICAKGVRIHGDEDPNISFDRHIRTDGCDPSNYNRVHKKAKCPVAGCKEKLTSVNTYTCKVCTQKVCMKHRLEIDHKCPGRSAHPLISGQRSSMAAAAAAAAAAGRNLGNKATSLLIDLTGGSSTAAGSSSSRGRIMQQQRQQQVDPSNTLYGSADRRRQMLGIPLRQQQQQMAAAAGAQGSEQCPQCNSRFATVQELIQHVESQHSNSSVAAPTAAAAGGGGGEVYPCPTCGTWFHDAVALVAHSQNCGQQRQLRPQQRQLRPQQQQQQCVLC